MPRWRKATLMIVFTVIFGGAGLAGAVLSWVNGHLWLGVFLLLAVGGVGLVAGIGTVRFLRETDDLAESDFVPVSPPRGPLPQAVGKKGPPWRLEQVADALAHAFAATPYQVVRAGDRLRIHADLVDHRWQVLATQRSLTSVFVVTLSAQRPGVFRRHDETRSLEWQAGVPGIGAQARVHSGRTFTRQRRVEFGLGRDGLTKEVDYTFSSGEINRPLREVLTAAGWRTGLDAETRTAIIIGGIGASAIPLVPLALLIKSMMQR